VDICFTTCDRLTSFFRDPDAFAVLNNSDSAAVCRQAAQLRGRLVGMLEREEAYSMPFCCRSRWRL